MAIKDNLLKKSIDDAVTSTAGKIKHSDAVKHWLDEIGEAQKREKGFRKEATRVVDIYEAEREDAGEGDTRSANAFNILYANTETLSPAVYNTVPRPVCRTRFKDDNPVGAVAAKVMQRTLEFLTDSNDPEESSFDDLQKSAVLEALLPGRGLARFKYDAQIQKIPAEVQGGKETEKVTSELVCGCEVPWNRVLFGYAKRWSQVPWQAFEHFMTKEECIANFGEEKGGAIALTAVASDSDKEVDNAPPADAEGVKFAHIWEIWDKKTKKVIFISDGAPGFLKEEDDPLKLTGFFPSPKPLVFLTKVKSLVPSSLYLMYEEQAQELNSVTIRIGKLTSALKIRGFYDGTLSGLDDLMKKPDNTLIAAPNVAAMQQGQTLDKSIWLMPLTEITSVLQQLYTNRQQVLQVIYQITGVADIMRGASQASETLGAQKMKEAWGTMRLKRMQKEVQRFVRDQLRIMAELAAENFDKETFMKMTGVLLYTNEQKQQVQEEGQRRMAQYQQQMAMNPPQPGQEPPPPPQMPPEMARLMAEPSWEDVLTLLKDNLLRNFIIDIETNSTVDAEATEDQQNVAEYMNALSQFLNGIGPMVEKGFMPFDVAKTMLLGVTRRFRFGVEVEDSIKAMTAPPTAKPGEDPKAKAEAAALQQETEFAKQKQALELQNMTADTELKKAQNAAAMELVQQKQQLSQAKFQAEMAKLGLSVQVAEMQATTAQQVGTAKVAAANAPKPEKKDD